MSAAHEPFDELAAGYALGALDSPELTRFRAHLAEGCDECVRAIADYEGALTAVATGEPTAPPPHVKRALMRRVGGRRRATSVMAWAASMALAAGVAAALTGVAMRSRYQPRLDVMAGQLAALTEQLADEQRTVVSLRQQLDAQQRTLVQVKAESAEQSRTLALLADPATRVVTLAGLAPSPAAQARVVWNPRAGGVLVAKDLPPAPADKTYELWAIAGGKPLPAGLFTVDAEGRGNLALPPLASVGDVEVFAVTLEPAGGVSSPTGAMYLASKPA